MKELKNCPFCGAAAELREWKNYPSLFRAACKNEEAPHYLDRWDETEAEAVASWNTRAQSGEDLQRLALELNDDNLRLSDLVTKFDTALRTIATEAGMQDAFTGIDCDPECKPLVEHVSNLRKALEASNQFILNGGFKS